MQPIGSNHQVKLAFRSALKAHANTAIALLNSSNAVTEDGFNLAVDGREDAGRQFTAWQADEVAMRRSIKGAGGKARNDLAMGVEHPDLTDLVSFSVDFGQQPHAVGNVVAAAPEVDNVPAGAQLRRSLDQGGLHAIVQQPVSKRRSCYSRS